jgi:hypothetical protein
MLLARASEDLSATIAPELQGDADAERVVVRGPSTTSFHAPVPTGEGPQAVVRKRVKQPKTAGDLVRYELKYLIHPSQVPLIRAYIMPYCRPDKHAQGDPPGYLNTTLLLDTPERAFYVARCTNADSRMKLRARVYATDGSSPVVMEIKRKIGTNIIKSRARVPFDRWGRDLCTRVLPDLAFKDPKEADAYREFVRLVQTTNARPATILRYRREPWFSVADDYARVTFDSQLMYQPTLSWDDWGRRRTWRNLDLAPHPERYAGTILELKTSAFVPSWMQDLICRFELQRRAVCKYAAAVEAEHALLPTGVVDDWQF